MFKTQYAKVVDSTYDPTKESKKMIGDICDVIKIHYQDKTILLSTKDKSEQWWFNFSDVLPATEEEYKAQFEKKEIEELEFSHNNNDILKKVNELVRAVNKLSK